MFNFLKEVYLSVKDDLVIFYMKVEEPLFQDLFTILFFVLLTLVIILTVKNAIDFYKLRRYNKKIRRNIEKSIMTSFLVGKDKNKEKENIK